MASFDLDPKSSRCHIGFRYAGQPFKRSRRIVKSLFKCPDESEGHAKFSAQVIGSGSNGHVVG